MLVDTKNISQLQKVKKLQLSKVGPNSEHFFRNALNPGIFLKFSEMSSSSNYRKYFCTEQILKNLDSMKCYGSESFISDT